MKTIYKLLFGWLLLSTALSVSSRSPLLASVAPIDAHEFSQYCARNASTCNKSDFQNVFEGTVSCPSDSQVITHVYVHAGDGQTVYQLPDPLFDYSYSNNQNTVTVTSLGQHAISWIGVVCEDPRQPSITVSPTPTKTEGTPTDTPTPTPTKGEEELSCDGLIASPTSGYAPLNVDFTILHTGGEVAQIKYSQSTPWVDLGAVFTGNYTYTTPGTYNAVARVGKANTPLQKWAGPAPHCKAIITVYEGEETPTPTPTETEGTPTPTNTPTPTPTSGGGTGGTGGGSSSSSSESSSTPQVQAATVLGATTLANTGSSDESIRLALFTLSFVLLGLGIRVHASYTK